MKWRKEPRAGSKVGGNSGPASHCDFSSAYPFIPGLHLSNEGGVVSVDWGPSTLKFRGCSSWSLKLLS